MSDISRESIKKIDEDIKIIRESSFIIKELFSYIIQSIASLEPLLKKYDKDSIEYSRIRGEIQGLMDVGDKFNLLLKEVGYE